MARMITTNHPDSESPESNGQSYQIPETPFPFLVLLLSGGHSQILMCNDVGSYTQLGGTLDDALGEAFDKVARILNINDGGKGLELEAMKGNPHAFSLPVPLKGANNCDFSFSGLKGAMNRLVSKVTLENGGKLSEEIRSDLAASFQYTAFKHIEDKISRAIRWVTNYGASDLPVNTLVVSGGVARNKVLRQLLESVGEQSNIHVRFPPIDLCTDNGVMVAWAGYELYVTGKGTVLIDKDDIAAVEARPRWPLANNEDTIFQTKYPAIVQLKRRGASIGGVATATA